MTLVNVVNLAYLLSAVLFIVGLKRLSSPATARSGNMLGATGMLIAVVVTLIDPGGAGLRADSGRHGDRRRRGRGAGSHYQDDGHAANGGHLQRPGWRSLRAGGLRRVSQAGLGRGGRWRRRRRDHHAWHLHWRRDAVGQLHCIREAAGHSHRPGHKLACHKGAQPDPVPYCAGPRRLPGGDARGWREHIRGSAALPGAGGCIRLRSGSCWSCR